MWQRISPERAGLCPDRLRRVSRWMDDYVERQRLPGLSVLIHRRDGTAFFETAGMMDLETGRPMAEDTLFRIYSMTKPVTSVAAMMLYEEGRFQLDDPVARFLPEFADMRVLTGGDVSAPQLEPARGPITVHHLLTHTSGLTYWFMYDSPVDAMYRDGGIDLTAAEGVDLAEMVRRIARMPLICHPGTEWNYSVSTDVLGRLVEVISGQDLESFFHERIFEPLGMTDTGFRVPEEKIGRLAALYQPEGGGGLAAVNASRDPAATDRGPDGGLRLLEPPGDSVFAQPVQLFSGGGGLVSSAGDYLRFCRMLLNRGELDGARLLGPRTVEYMTTNHLPGDMASMGQPRFSETSYEGIGFGLGFSVVLDPARAQTLGSAGEYAWGGAASTGFWIDPAEDLIVILLTQLIPSTVYPLRRELRVLTYQALDD